MIGNQRGACSCALPAQVARPNPPGTVGTLDDRLHRPRLERLRASHLAVSVDRELLLVPFELRPVDVAVVVILQQNLPLLKRLAVAVALPGTSVDDLGALLAFAVGVGARIERVLEHRDRTLR